jgi:catechol 2,3-dioxygenase-like lactoylglutathione lyase family enzyme
VLWTAAVPAQTPADGAPPAHFHHIHLNSTAPAEAAAFYARHFDCERTAYAGKEAVRTQKSWLLFDPVPASPAWQPTSAIWHFGWGAEDMKSAYRAQLDLGAKFFTPLTDISDLAGVADFFYAYVEGPDRALIELNTANHHRFGHLHLFSEDPVSAGEWYIRNFGAVRRGNRPPSREVRLYRGVPVGPSMSLMMDNVNIIIFPAAYSRAAYKEYWNGKPALDPTRGRVADHIGFSVSGLAETAKRLTDRGIRVDSRDGALWIEGPDRITIEIVEEPKAGAQ